MIKKYISDLKKEFKNYKGRVLAKDMMAGMTVAAVALPLALAFGVSAGATAASGLVTAIIAGVIISALSGGYFQISGPTGAMAAILISIIGTHGLQGMFLVTFMAGILLIIAAIFHLGNLTSFVPMPVITGFTSGIAIIIALGQIDNFFGVSSQGRSALEKLISYGERGFSVNISTTLIGVCVVVLMLIYPKKWNAVIPSSLVAIILVTAGTILFGINTMQVGEIPQKLILENRLSFQGIELSDITSLIIPAISIAALNLLESLLCGASASRVVGVKFNSDQELLAQGIGNIILPFFGGMPATAALARTSVAVRSGARTRLTGIFHAVFLLIMMFLLAPVISKIPLSALAGVLMVTALRMNEWTTIKYMFSRKFKAAIAKFIITMLATVIFDLTIAIVIGVSLSLINLISRLSKLKTNYEKVDMKRIGINDEALEKRYSNTLVVYITGPIIFSNTEDLDAILESSQRYDTILFSMRGVPFMDISGAKAFMEMISTLKEAKIDIALCGLSDDTKKMTNRSGISELLGETSFYWSVERALMDLRP